MNKYLVMMLLLMEAALAARPDSYTELLDYVQEAPDQGETATCLFVASTGAIELISNKLYDIKDPRPNGQFDLAESFVIHASSRGRSFFEDPVHRFNSSKAVHISYWPFEAWIGDQVNNEVWSKHPQFDSLPRMSVPKIETVKLFQYGNRWSTSILGNKEIESIKQALWKNKFPVMVNYNDGGFWHVILIVGYDDTLEGDCYETEAKDCKVNVGSFYIRDSFGVKVEVRDSDWFRIKGNAAFVVRPTNL